VIERKIRAFDPWPGAYTLLRDDAGRDRKLKVFGTRIVRHEETELGEFRINTSDGALQLQEVQLEGKKRMRGSDFLRGHPWVTKTALHLSPPQRA